MSALAERFAAAAEALTGTRFLLHGRSPATGLDCVGLVGAALAACGRQVRTPEGYRLRNAAIDCWLECAAANGLIETQGPPARGDVLLIRAGPAQHHLLVALGQGCAVHAHAGLGRVVIEPLDLTRPPVAQWRLDPRSEQTWQP